MTLRETLGTYPGGLAGLRRCTGISKQALWRLYSKTDGHRNLPYQQFARIADAFKKKRMTNVTQVSLCCEWMIDRTKSGGR